MIKKYCSACTYHIAGDPPVCNALHSPSSGAIDCNDYEKRTDSFQQNRALRFTYSPRDSVFTRRFQEELEAETIQGRLLISVIHEKINSYYRKTGKHPEKILIHWSGFMLIQSYMARTGYISGDIFTSMFQVDVIKTNDDIPRDFVGIVET